MACTAWCFSKRSLRATRNGPGWIASYNRLRSFSGFGLSESSEVAVRLPLWPLARVRNPFDELEHELVELRCGRQINGLLRIIRGRVVTVLKPLRLRFIFRRVRGCAELRHDGGNT